MRTSHLPIHLLSPAECFNVEIYPAASFGVSRCNYGLVYVYRNPEGEVFHRIEERGQARATYAGTLELKGVLHALAQVRDEPVNQITVFGTRNFVLSATNWAYLWKAGCWRKKGKPILDAQQWAELLDYCKTKPVKFKELTEDLKNSFEMKIAKALAASDVAADPLLLEEA